MFRPPTEAVQCPCGEMFVRENRTYYGKKKWGRKSGRPQIYCERCREAYRRGKPYGETLAPSFTFTSEENDLSINFLGGERKNGL